MKGKEIRDRLNQFKFSETKTDIRLPYTVVAYAAGFPNGVYLYAAPEPPDYSKWPPDVYQPWTITPVKPEEGGEVVPPKIDRSKVDKCELDELIQAVLDLKGQSVEIYKLKAVAIGIKERNENSNRS